MLERSISLLGLAAFIAFAWLLSLNRRKFPLRTVISGVLLQFTLALLILKTSPGHAFFNFANSAVAQLLSYADEGTRFVFGPLGDGDLLLEKFGAGNAFIFVVTVTGTIILVSALSSFLYHYGILQRVVKVIAWIMQRVMRTSGSESLASAANIFMGQTEAPLVIKPYLARMTRSELMALMTGGMATIAGGVLAAYVQFGNAAGRADMAGHLLTASVMSAPAALLIAKIILPETEPSETAGGANAKLERLSSNGVDALCLGAGDGMKLAINVMAMLIAFVAIVALANGLLASIQHLVGIKDAVSLETIFGYLNAPFAWLMGAPAQDCLKLGEVLGKRVVLNEFLGYLSLSDLQKAGAISDRSFTLGTYALCGFANFSSIAIQIGGIGALAPERRSELAALGFRAMIGGLLACYMTATVVGILL
ncbi:MAG: nucleoside transporter C-terminal domain-containing protein [Chthoniobacteraceae bacterium]